MPLPPRRFSAWPLLLLAAACGGGPEFVYVPATGYQQAITVRADLPDTATVATGRWVTLRANRIMGPWQKVRRTEVPDSVRCRLRTPPTSPDIDIASKLRWKMLPAGSVKFNMPGPPDYDRQIQFTAPGEYRLWAESDGPCGGRFTSDTLMIRVK